MEQNNSYSSLGSAISPINSKRVVVMELAIHLLALGILFILPEVLIWYFDNGSEIGRHSRPPELTISKGIAYIAVFYINYLLIVPSLNRVPKQLRIASYICVNIAIIGIAAFVLHHVVDIEMKPDRLMPHPPPGMPHPHPRPKPMIGVFMIRDAVIMTLIAALAATVRIAQHAYALKRRESEIEAISKASELESLKSQLNPHFLFNTLNTIYALVAIDPTKAQNAIYELSKMLRYLLYDSSTTVTLEQECNLVTNYIDLMKLRLDEGAALDISINPGEYASQPIMPLAFLTPVENIFKHGDLHSTSPRASIRIEARDGMVEFRSVNAIAANTRARTDSGGIGMFNLSRRLHLIYGKGASLETSEEQNSFTTIIRINLDGNVTLHPLPSPPTSQQNQ